MEIKVMPLHACIKASMCHSYVVERGAHLIVQTLGNLYNLNRLF